MAKQDIAAVRHFRNVVILSLAAITILAACFYVTGALVSVVINDDWEILKYYWSKPIDRQFIILATGIFSYWEFYFNNFSTLAIESSVQTAGGSVGYFVPKLFISTFLPYFLYYCPLYNPYNNNKQMIVPEFKLRQTPTHLQLYIRVPYLKVSSAEFYIESNTFKFYLKPYLLSLTFEQPLKEVEEPAKAVYYSEKYILEVHLLKEREGEEFKDLDLIAELVNNKKQKKNRKPVGI